jgi:hypothetical protein
MDDLNPSTKGTIEPQAQGDVQTTPQELPTVNQEEQVLEDDFSLSESANDRTKEQFQKLLQRNKELNEKLKTFETSKKNEPEAPAYASVYETFKTDPFAMGTSQEVDYIDEDGNVDIEKLNKDLKALKVSALEARRLAEQAREDIEVREAHAKHPYLDPQSSEFDPAFFDLVKDRVLSKRFYEGKNIPLIKIADEVISFYKPKGSEKKDGEKAVAEYKKSQQQILTNAPVSSNTARRVEQSDVEDLRERTLKGDKEALAKRLSRI